MTTVGVRQGWDVIEECIEFWIEDRPGDDSWRPLLELGIELYPGDCAVWLERHRAGQPQRNTRAILRVAAASLHHAGQALVDGGTDKQEAADPGKGPTASPRSTLRGSVSGCGYHGTE